MSKLFKLSDFLLIPNLITLFRFLLIAPMIITFKQGLQTYFLIILFTSLFTDFLDGIVARRLNQQSELGKTLDPIADGITLFSFIILFNREGLISNYFLIFYFLCGFGAAFTQYIIDPNSSIPMVGASGAIAGVLGAYMISFPKAKVHVFAFIIIFITTLAVPAQIVLGLWFFIQLSSGLNSLGIDTNGGVAWFAHIGGFISGVGSIKYIQNYKIEGK